ncbi:Conserved hypothetical protein [Pseudomonas knackmussii B13]|uniref:Rieske domain-containing protein n=1 Tax=Pseudomonas knackmussii (strain DSM 6978 / CCUG 54928 / LMG 23759 / B13) TaxID=1301098 RepID=A0A024HJ42_PSEKB|nr:Conserved hypothetical protein [Pseudomonas knackmussii B13]
MVDATELCALEEIPDGGAKSLELALDGERLALVAVRRGSEAWLYRNRCPHFSVPLDFRSGEFCTYGRQWLMCAHHSAMFRFEDGLCVDGPCTGAHLQAQPFRLEEGRLWLLTAAANADF